MIYGDFETRSEAELKRCGTYVYASHPSTEALCFAFAFDDRDDVYLWHPAFPAAGLEERRPPELAELFERLALGEEFEAHNAMFERCVWQFVMQRLHGWPPIDGSQWRCSAALAASYALPRRLEDVARVLGVREQKDAAAGSRLIPRLSKPRKPTKADPRSKWSEKRDDLLRLFEYCRQDVRAEKAVSRSLRPLPPSELEVWQLDQKVNLRGVYCDREMVRAAIAHACEEQKAAAEEVRTITRGAVSGTTKREELLAWVKTEGFLLDNTQASTIDQALERGSLVSYDPLLETCGDYVCLPEHVARVLELWRRTNRTSTKKYQAMLERVSEDGRIRDLLRYHGASTGRWAGQGIQPQNFPRETPDDMDEAARDITTRDREYLRFLYGDVMDLLSGGLRGALCAPEGRELVAADYAAIEARGTFWLAGDDESLEVFRKYDRGQGPAIYAVQAGEIYGIDAAQVRKGSIEYQTGKQAILGLGYQMGVSKFVATCAGYGIVIPLDAREVLVDAGHRERVERVERDHRSSEARAAALRKLKAELCPGTVTAEEVVQAYREGHPKVPELWRDIEAAAIEATRRGPGAKPVPCGPTSWAVRGRFLHCRLPSGRRLSYAAPRVVAEQTRWGIRPKLKFWGVNSYTRKWEEQATYGGKLVENVVQALCRDLMAEAMKRVEAAGYEVVLSVHDELVAEVPEGFGSVEEFESLMAEVPPWAKGMPIAAEGWRGRRYRK